MSVNLATTLIGPFRAGMRNDGVRLVQMRLNEVLAGTPGHIRLGTDGIFGSRTGAAVARFQKSRQLRVDQIVGPITARALGFTGYTTPKRIAQGAQQLAAAVAAPVTAWIARLVPAPQKDPDPIYNSLLALVVHADVMHRAAAVLGTLPGASGAASELSRIVAGLQGRLTGWSAQNMLAEFVQRQQAYADSVHGRLMALSQQLQALAQRPQPGRQSDLTAMVQLLVLQTQMLAAHARIRRVLQDPASHTEPADEMLKIAANVARSTRNMLPRL